jgi:hypothetical protein
MELVETYAQTLRGNSKAWLDMWSLVAQGAPPASSWIDETNKIWARWLGDMAEVSGAWGPSSHWLHRDQISTISFAITGNSESVGPKEAWTPGFTEGDVQVVTTPLRLIGVPRSRPSREDTELSEIGTGFVSAKIDRLRLSLSVSLIRLKELSPNRLCVGSQYLGCAYVDGPQPRPLALLHVVVTG